MVEETFPQFFSTFDMDKSAGKSTISKITKFESDLLKTNECFQIFAILPSYIFAHLRCMTFKLGNFTKFSGTLSSGINGFSLTCSCQKLKKP